MPDASGGDRSWLRDKQLRVKAKLKKLGIDPRTNKYNELYWRFLRQ